MARSKSVPTYRLHKQSGQAVVTLVDPTGRRKDVLLGRYGTTESRAEYARVIAEWEVNARRLAKAEYSGTDLTVNEVLLRFWHHVEQHYRHADGTPTTEVENYRYSLRPVRELYGHTMAGKFGPLALKAVRQTLIDAKLSRTLINQRIGRIKRAFKWAVGEELVPPAVYHGLQAVSGLAKGRSAAKERPPVVPVLDEHVDAVLRVVNRHVAGMIRVQRHTGMRPSEVCQMRRCDLDTSEGVWLYRPMRHKTAWRGKPRVIAIGPAAQAVLGEFMTPAAEAYLFSPAQAVGELRARQRAERKSKVTPSQTSRKKKNPKKRPGERYTHRSYDQAIRKACKKAGVPHWHPNQLRHTFATAVRKRFGLEAAQVGLGHARADVTQVYAEADIELATTVAQEIG